MKPRQIDGELIGVCGASRSGKTVWTRRQVYEAVRLLVWDPKSEWCTWPELIRVDSWEQLSAVLRDETGGYSAAPGRFAFVPAQISRDSFNTWASAAHQWGRAAPCTLVAEETPDVTGTSKAGSHWGTLVRQGLGAGIDIYALTQSPSESDKTTLRNATRIHTHRLGFHRDRQYMAQLLDCAESQVIDLQPLEYLDGAAGGQLHKGRLGFAKSGLCYQKGRSILLRAGNGNIDT